jgi:fatty acid desaturase
MAKGDADARKPVSIEGDIDAVTLRTFLAIITSEITGVAVSIVVATVWKPAWIILWLAPLLLKLIAACFAVPRHRFTPEPLAEEGDQGEEEDNPPRGSFYLENGQGFQIIEGPIHIVRPFFRHYGHPKRQRWSELV